MIILSSGCITDDSIEETETPTTLAPSTTPAPTTQPPTTTISPDNIPPDPFITNPSNSWDLYGNSWKITAISGEIIRLTAVELNLANDIVSTQFEYSANGDQWTFIGEDYDPSFEGEWFGEEGDVRNGEGLGGWNIWWDISDLPEGYYYIRTIMRDDAGQEGSYISEVYYDPTPPIPIIQSPVFESQLTGLVQFEVTTTDEDISYYELEVFNGSGNKASQKNIGDLSQYDVGPNVDGSSTLDGKNNFCGPTSVANGIWRLANKNSKLKNFGGKQLSLKDLAKLLAKKMAPTVPGDDAGKTKGLEEIQKKGVTPEQMQKGVRDYLTEIGLGCENDQGYSVKIIKNPTWEQYFNELKSGQCVILFIIPKGKKTGGHFVAGNSANNKANTDGSHTFGTTDSQNAWNSTDKTGTWKEGSDVKYDNKDQYVHSLIVICPKKSVDIPKDTFVSIDPAGSNNRDYSSSGGWVVEYDTNGVKDGFFLFRTKLVDEKGTAGTDFVSVYVNNNAPKPNIIEPLEGDIVNGTIPIIVVDDLDSEDISKTTFELQNGGEWQIISIDEDDSDGWTAVWNSTNVADGTYLLKASMIDYGGGEGTDTIEIHVDNVPDIEGPIVEITNPEDNVEVFSPQITIVFHASDFDSGIVRIDYTCLWLGGSVNDSRYYDPPQAYIPLVIDILNLSEGWNVVTIGAEDAAGNYGSDSITIYYSPEIEDTTPPNTSKEVGQPNWEDGYVIAPYTPIWLHAIDDQSGVDYIYYEIAWDHDEDGIWDETFQEMVSVDMLEIHIQDWGILHGIIELRWYAVDNDQNKEQTQTQQHKVMVM